MQNGTFFLLARPPPSQPAVRPKRCDKQALTVRFKLAVALRRRRSLGNHTHCANGANGVMVKREVMRVPCRVADPS